MRFDGGTQEQYDAVQAHVGGDADPPQGMIFHVSGPVEGGWEVIDVWESRDAYHRFVETRLGPALEALGERAFSAPPDVKEFPVHHFIKP